MSACFGICLKTNSKVIFQSLYYTLMIITYISLRNDKVGTHYPIHRYQQTSTQRVITSTDLQMFTPVHHYRIIQINHLFSHEVTHIGCSSGGGARAPLNYDLHPYCSSYCMTLFVHTHVQFSIWDHLFPTADTYITHSLYHCI